MKSEVLAQPSRLEDYSLHKVELAQQGSVFVGAGDSYLAACVANRLSSMQHIVVGPYDLMSEPRIAKGRDVYFVSISGRTVSNTAASKAVEEFAARRIAITADMNSDLARSADSTIVLPYETIPRQPGMLSFSLSTLALLKLTVGHPVLNFGSAMSNAMRAAPQVGYSERGVNNILGNGPVYPVCQYAVLKAYEITGESAMATPLEEFGHSPVFGLQKGDTVNVFDAFDPSRLGVRLKSLLTKAGIRTAVVRVRGTNDLERVFCCIFTAQLAMLRRAKAMGLTRPYFAGASEKLAISDSLIY